MKTVMMRLFYVLSRNEYEPRNQQGTDQARAVGNTYQVLRRLLRPIGARVHPHFQHEGRRKGGIGGGYEANDKIKNRKSVCPVDSTNRNTSHQQI